MASVANLNIKFTSDTKNLVKGIATSTSAIQKFAGRIQSVGGLFAGAFAVGQVSGLIRAISDTTAEFEKYAAILKNTLQSSEAAAESMKMLKEFASKTPFQLNELTESYVKLVNRGFKPSVKELTKLGDIASSTGKTFSQLAEAILDAETGEFERLKEFGIKAKSEGDQVVFTFKEVSTTVKKTASSIRDYILGLGEAVGVSGSMEVISATLGGRISNLKDRMDEVRLALGTALLPIFEKGIAMVQNLAGKITELSAEQIKHKLTTLAVTAAFITLIPVVANLITAIPKLVAGIKAMTIAMMANPIGLLVGGLTIAIASLIPKLVNWWEEMIAARKELIDIKPAIEGVTRAIYGYNEALSENEQRMKSLSLAGLYKMLADGKAALAKANEADKKGIQESIAAIENEIKRREAAGETIKATTGLINSLNEAIKKNNEQIQSTNNLNEIARLEGENAQLEIKLARIKAIGDEMRKLVSPEVLPAKGPEYIPPKTDQQPVYLPQLVPSTQPEQIGYMEQLKVAMQLVREEYPGLQTDGIATFEALGDAVESFTEKQKRAVEVADYFSQQFISGVSQGAESFEEFGKQILNTIRSVIAGLIAKGVAHVIEGTLATSSALGPFAIPIAAAAGGLAAGMFNTAIPSFAQGGLAYGPTMALVGDNPNARIDPEVTAPLSKLEGMMQPVRVIGETQIRGRDLYILWHKEQDFLNRT